jgi:hypothetical protein
MHRFLGIGLMLVTAAFLVLRFSGLGPAIEDDAAKRVMAYAMVGVSVILGAVGVLVMKPRVPALTPGQTLDAYWSTPAVGAKALAVWGLLEAAGLTAAVGYFLTGELLCVLATASALALFRWAGPDSLAQ